MTMPACKQVILLTLKCCGWYLLPWARLSDWVAEVVSSRCNWCRPHGWRIAAGIFGSIAMGHCCLIALTIHAIFDAEWGLAAGEAPCVCKATRQCVGCRHTLIILQPDSLVSACVATCKSICFFLVSVSCVIQTMVSLTWSHPWPTLGVTVFLMCIWTLA